MSLTVEDGTIVAGAESYITVAAADTYFSNRGNATWAALTTTQKEVALRLGCDYLEANYSARWCGDKVETGQALSWPRTGTIVANDVIPEVVKRANADLAIKSVAGELQADQGAAVKEETIGAITVVYQDGARQATNYTAVNAMLQSSGLLCYGANQIGVVRA
jgi:hypothetical protein